jgi:FkbM family methyltransferase
MSIISYAQNFEDVMLARVFADIERGFYVDVGAQDPVVDSVTKLFYDRGWCGINIEPVPHWFERLQQARPRDINLRCAVGERDGTLVLHEFEDSGLSTSSESFAQDHVAAGRSMVDRVVPVTRLDSILADHAPADVHFLKIDVEGMEKEVLAGLSLRRWRPWVLVIEATQPNRPVDSSDAWEPIVLAAGYRLAYRDGLNRFYIADEQRARTSAFDVPPNVFDDFIQYREHRGNEYARTLERRLDASHERIEQLGRDLTVVTETAQARGQRLDELGSALEQREGALQEAANTAERYRLDLLQVTRTAQDMQARLQELDSAVRDRQAALETKAFEAERYRLQLQAVATAAENRQVVIASLEARVGEVERQLWEARRATQTARARGDVLQAELALMLASRSWRMTSPLRAMSRVARRLARPVLRFFAAITPLRVLGRWLLPERLRQRVLALAGFANAPVASAATEPLDDIASPAHPVAELTHGGRRVYRMLSAIGSERSRDGMQ